MTGSFVYYQSKDLLVCPVLVCLFVFLFFCKKGRRRFSWSSFLSFFGPVPWPRWPIWDRESEIWASVFFCFVWVGRGGRWEALIYDAHLRRP